MNQDTHSFYDFDNLPLNPVRSGTSVLVAGPALEGPREIALTLLSAGEDRSDGTLFIAVDENCEGLLADYEAIGGSFDRNRMAIIDCGGPAETDHQNVRAVGSPSDLTGIGIEYTSLYEDLHNEGIGRVRTAVCSVSTLLVYADELQPVYRFLHTLTGRVQSAEGFMTAVIDPTTQDDLTLNSIMQTLDGRIDVRQDDEGVRELRVRGLPDQPSGWQRC